ncbi:MAG: DUF3857 domain-containing protein [Vicinamibacteria bacterium]|nr:DUF3857 domain-containing protein [Vicinamibacteria bacterium]
MARGKAAFLGLALGCALAGPAIAEKLPPITQEERDLKTVPNEPSASAVFLIQRGLIHLRNFRFQDSHSTIAVQARIKILKEEGKDRGEVSIPHGSYVRLSRFEGRTITPDGKVLKVDSKGKFKRRLSETTKRNVTSIAFPGVEVGAILEYEYELAFDSFYFVEPWYFMDELPVIRSEVVWEVPNELRSRIWMVPTFDVQVVPEQKQRSGYVEAKFSARNLPSTPREVYGFPFRDQAARMMVVPMSYADEYVNIPLLDSWASVCEGMEKDYVLARKQATQVGAKASSLTTGKPADDAAPILYRFVRDEIKNTSDDGPWIDDRVTVDKVLAKGEGSSIEKALLLQSLLSAVNVNSQLVWAADRSRGRVLADLPNPGAFDRILVRVTREGGFATYYDPVDRSLGPGRLAPDYEGTLALVHDAKKPETITLPITSFAAHQKKAVISLTVNDEGHTTGNGELTLKGHYAWEKSAPRREAKDTTEAWQKWADAAMPGFKVTGIRVEDKPDEATLRVEWSMAATEESTLGDEVTLNPARPIGPFSQPFTVSETERRSPIMMDHGGIEEMELKISWPKGWSLATRPQPSSMDAGIASYTVELPGEAAPGTFVYKRNMQVRKREPADRVEYAALRNLFTEAEKRDAQTLVLARR